MYKIRNQYKYAINFSFPNANPNTFNSLFDNSSNKNSNLKLFYALEPSCILDNKKTEAKAKKNTREKKKIEARKKRRLQRKWLERRRR